MIDKNQDSGYCKTYSALSQCDSELYLFLNCKTLGEKMLCPEYPKVWTAGGRILL